MKCWLPELEVLPSCWQSLPKGGKCEEPAASPTCDCFSLIHFFFNVRTGDLSRWEQWTESRHHLLASDVETNL